MPETTPAYGAASSHSEEVVKGESLWLISSLVVGIELGCGEGDVTPQRPAPGNRAQPSSLSEGQGVGGDH